MVLSCGKARGSLRKLLIFLCAAVLAVPSLPLRAECLLKGVTCWRRSGAATSERDSNETRRYVLTICICLSSERDIIVVLMDVREGTRNFSLCLRHQSACRHRVLCNFYFLQPWVIACLSACFFLFFFYQTVKSLSAHIVHCGMTLPFFEMYKEKIVLCVFNLSICWSCQLQHLSTTLL